MRTTPLALSVGLVAGTLVALSAAGGAQAATGRYEAETSPAVCTGTIDSDWTGFSGSGFCNGTNAVGAYAQFAVTAPAAGTATLTVRFANGTTTARPADVVVNGSTVAAGASFESTGTWTGWTSKTFTVPVAAGTNTVRLSPTTAAGLPNVDHVELSTADTPAPSGPAPPRRAA
ncbi:carbohydrate-binding protein, partial [Streptomyces sp. NPDC058757]|uniref:carbohydrate-binding protein n=1 Tax=Streptomyces sp. NPDC058757 TaxID=3346626 RepID=UPI0036A7523E